MNELLHTLSRRSLVLGSLFAAACVVRRKPIGSIEELQPVLELYGKVRVEITTKNQEVITGSVAELNDQKMVLVLSSQERYEIALADIEQIRVFYVDKVLSILVWTLGPPIGALIAVAVAYGIVFGVALLLILILLPFGSCPLVYVVGRDGKRRLIGEAYSGANAKNLARADLMPLPPAEDDTLVVVLANEADETQLTDLAALEVVDVRVGTRVLATADAGLMQVREAVPPQTVSDLEGSDFSEVLRAGGAWMTDLSRAVSRPAPPEREGLVMRFESAPPGAVLEVVLQNTPWLEFLNQQYWMSFGEKAYARVVERGRDPQRAAVRLESYREAGVHALVEVRQGGETAPWQHVAWLPPVGFVASRRLAVPLPGLREGEPVEVRLSGGVGFLMVHEAGLCEGLGAASPVRVDALQATGSSGADERARLASADGQLQILPERGTAVTLRFPLPVQAEGTERSLFLHTHGYYEQHASEAARLRLGVVLPISRDPARFSAYSVAMWRAVEERLKEGVALE